MKRFMLAMMALGLLLLGVILYRTDLREVWSRLLQVGWWGFALILLLYLVCWLCLASSWLFTLQGLRPSPAWVYRLWKALMVGFAIESTTPLAGLGGEPIKAILLKRHYGVRYRDAVASQVLARTTDLLALILFVGFGLLLMFRSELLPLPYKVAAGSGLAVLVFFIVIFVAAQRQRSLSRLHGLLERGWLGGRTLSARAVQALDSLHDIDERLLGYYAAERGRLALSVASALGDWVVGTVAVWAALDFLGHPVSFADAIVIEAFLVAVRSTLFFVPADLGTQEAALVLICGAIAGSGEAGLALSAVRRARDVVWILWGLAIGSAHWLRDDGLLEKAAEGGPLEEGEALAERVRLGRGGL